jgi:hypothetical protein
MQWNPIDLLLHLNDHLDQLALQIGGWSYLLLFLIVFCESGLVVTPFLPGDALLFTVGALSATTKHFELYLVLITLSIIGSARFSERGFSSEMTPKFSIVNISSKLMLFTSGMEAKP